jgi:hypothetical protein
VSPARFNVRLSPSFRHRIESATWSEKCQKRKSKLGLVFDKDDRTTAFEFYGGATGSPSAANRAVALAQLSGQIVVGDAIARWNRASH